MRPLPPTDSPLSPLSALRTATGAQHDKRVRALTALLLVAENYPEREAELKALSISYRSAPTAESARIYLMALEALVALALRVDALALAARSAEGADAESAVE